MMVVKIEQIIGISGDVYMQNISRNLFPYSKFAIFISGRDMNKLGAYVINWLFKKIRNTRMRMFFKQCCLQQNQIIEQ